MLLGALEAGGTKMVCAVGNENGEILEQTSIKTEEPETTLSEIINYFKQKDINALGIGTFGPVNLNKNSPEYGYITTTPKKPWINCNIRGILKDALNIPIGLDTDVNASALGEATWGITKGLDTSIYITIGTGFGVGVLANGKLLHGMLHPEAGHIIVNRHPDDTYEGHCPYHKNCVEGFTCGPAIEQRWGKKGYELSDNKKVWEIESYYVAQAIVNYILTLSPQKIVLGGGVMHQEILFPMIRKNVKELINNYIVTDELKDLDNYIVPCSLNDKQGIMGCLKLAAIELSL